MTENQQPKINQPKKNQFFLIKLLILLAVIFFGYFAFKYWRSLEFKTKTEINKSDNGESGIFDLSDEYKNQSDEDSSRMLSDMTMNELREKGAEFIYQMLLKNQVQINDLKAQTQELKAEFLKYKNREKIGKLIFTYVDLRQKFYSGQPYEEDLKNLEILAYSDNILQDKIAKLKSNLKNFSTNKKLVKELNLLIPELIAKKNSHPNPSLLDKIRDHFARLIVIRRVDGKGSKVDIIIANTEKALQEENYQEALNSMLSLDKNYHQILEKFLENLNFSAEAQRLDRDIFNYLKNLI